MDFYFILIKLNFDSFDDFRMDKIKLQVKTFIKAFIM